MRPILMDAIAEARGVVRRERALVATGLLGVTLAAGVAVVTVVRGPVVPPEGILHKALTFDLAVGIYVLTLAALAPLARFSPLGGAAWRAGVILTSLYGYTVETIQTLRGIDPRFTQVGTSRDEVFGLLFAVDAFFIILMFAIFAAKLFRRRALAERPLLVLAARYGALGAFLGFSGGVWMSVNAGRTWGSAGNVLPFHALGFHALQAVPLVAWLLLRSRVTPGAARRSVHAAGLLWLGATVAVGIQTWLGRAVVETAPLTLAATALLGGWVAIASSALAAARRAAARQRTSA